MSRCYEALNEIGFLLLVSLKLNHSTDAFEISTPARKDSDCLIVQDLLVEHSLNLFGRVDVVVNHRAQIL